MAAEAAISRLEKANGRMKKGTSVLEKGTSVLEKVNGKWEKGTSKAKKGLFQGECGFSQAKWSRSEGGKPNFETVGPGSRLARVTWNPVFLQREAVGQALEPDFAREMGESALRGGRCPAPPLPGYDAGIRTTAAEAAGNLTEY